MDLNITKISLYNTKFYLRQGQLSTESSQTPNIGDSLDISRQSDTMQATATVTDSATNTSATSTRASDEPQVPALVSLSTPEITGRTPQEASTSGSENSTGTDEVLVDRSTSNTSSEEWRRPSVNDVYYYTDDAVTDDKDVQQTSVLTNTSETDDDDTEDIQQQVQTESASLQQLSVMNETGLDIGGSEEIDNSSSTEVVNDSFVANRPQSVQIQVSMLSTTSTASPLSTAWLLAELPSDPDWTNEVQSSGEYVATHRESPSSRAMTFSTARFGPHWRLFHRLSRPARRRASYRQMLASPFVAGGGAMTERERKRALLQAYLLSGIAGKDKSHRRAMSAAVFYRSKLTKPSAIHHDGGGQPRQTNNAQLSAWNLPAADVTASPQDSDRVDVTNSRTDSFDNSSSSSWSILNNSSASLNYSISSWMSEDNATYNATASAVGMQMQHTSSTRAAAAAVVIPIIVGFLESLTKKQFSWLDMTLAVCGTVAAVLGLINLVVFVVHLLRTKRGKLSFHAERPLTSSTPSSMSASRSSSDSTPPPPPPPPPLPLTGFGALSRSSREVSRDVLADDETLRIRPLTFKRPLNDWGFASSHALTATADATVTGQGGAVTVKSTGSDASSSGIESTGGRSDVDSARRARENSGNLAVGSSVITNYAYCGNGGVNRGIIIDVDDYRDRTCTSPSDFVFSKNYG